MKYKKLKRALDGLYAYDWGSVDSGIHDPHLKAKVIAHLGLLEPHDRRALLARVTADLWLSPEAVRQGYGVEDAAGFIDWLDGCGVIP